MTSASRRTWPVFKASFAAIYTYKKMRPPKLGVNWASNTDAHQISGKRGETIFRFRDLILDPPRSELIFNSRYLEPLAMTKFLSLPVEIRDLIYGDVLPRRVITVVCVYSRHTVRLHGRLLPPAIFQVCRKMRTQALSTYARCEITTSRYARHCRDYENAEISNTGHPKTYVYVSYKYDTFYIPYQLKNILSVLDLEITRIESLAVMLDWDVPEEWYIDLREICKRLNLKTLKLVKSKGVPGSLNRSAMLRESVICNGYSSIVKRISEKSNGLLPHLVTEYPGDPESELYKEDNITIQGCPAFSWTLVNIEYDHSSLVRRWTVLTRFSDNGLKEGL